MIQAFDWAALELVQGLHCGYLDGLFPLITALGDGGFIWILCGVGFLFTKRTLSFGAALLLALALGALIGNVWLKNLVQRPRPFAAEPLTLLIPPPGGFSFPSGHSTAAFAGATMLYAKDRFLGRGALVLAALIAFSRVYLYVHYPTDVLCGALLGMGCGIFVSRVWRRATAGRTLTPPGEDG